MSEHYTPGPWILAHPREDEPEIYIADIHDREGNWIADVWCEPPHASANARLIAAAPDLLEAIKVALEDLVNYELIEVTIILKPKNLGRKPSTKSGKRLSWQEVGNE